MPNSPVPIKAAELRIIRAISAGRVAVNPVSGDPGSGERLAGAVAGMDSNSAVIADSFGDLSLLAP